MKTGLEQQAYQDVAQLLFDATGDLDRGLLPDFKDPQLLVPYPMLVARVMQDHPQVRDVLRQEYGKPGQLRLRAAMAAGDPQAVEGVAVQFCGTGVAVEARRWLGDRALSAGHFAEAMAHYQQALPHVDADERPALAARIRLAGAMLGSRTGEPVNGPVALGKSRLSAGQFEKLVAELAKAHAPSGGVEEAGGMGYVEVPPASAPAAYTARPWPQLDPRDAKQADQVKYLAALDWASSSLSLASSGELVILSDGLRLAAVKLSSGAQRWLREFSDAKPPLPTWKEVPFRPLVAGGRVYLRHWSEQGLRLSCLDGEGGKDVWTSPPRCHVVSDPLFDRTRVLALTVALEEPPASRKGARPPEWHAWRGRAKQTLHWQLQLTAFEPVDGKVLGRWPLIRLQNRERAIPVCQAAAAGDRIAVSFAGGVLLTDRTGKLYWARRHFWQDSDSQPAAPRTPLLAGGRVFAIHPGAEAVQCLDLESGRLQWECQSPDVTRLVGLADHRLIVQNEVGLVAIETGAGQTAWRHPVDNPPKALLCGGPGQLDYAAWERDDSDKWCPALVWLDAASGKTVARHFLDGLNPARAVSKHFSLGPVLVAGSRLFAAYRDPNLGRKGLLELVLADELSAELGMADGAR